MKMIHSYIVTGMYIWQSHSVGGRKIQGKSGIGFGSSLQGDNISPYIEWKKQISPSVFLFCFSPLKGDITQRTLMIPKSQDTPYFLNLWTRFLQDESPYGESLTYFHRYHNQKNSSTYSISQALHRKMTSVLNMFVCWLLIITQQHFLGFIFR